MTNRTFEPKETQLGCQWCNIFDVLTVVGLSDAHGRAECEDTELRPCGGETLRAAKNGQQI